MSSINVQITPVNEGFNLEINPPVETPLSLEVTPPVETPISLEINPVETPISLEINPVEDPIVLVVGPNIGRQGPKGDTGDITPELLAALEAAEIAVEQAALDRIATGEDRIAVEADKETVAADKAIVSSDKETVAADKATVSSDKEIVAADKEVVAADKAVVSSDKGIVAADKAQVSADKAIVAADKDIVAADKLTTEGYKDLAAADRTQTGLDRIAVAADKATVAADKATVAADKLTTEGYKNDAAASAASTAAAVTAHNADTTAHGQTTAGRALLTAVDAAAQRTSLGLAATATSTDAGNLTGTLDAARIADASLSIAKTSGLQTALEGKQPLSSVLTATTASFTTAQETKLAGVATGATANQTDAYLLSRANHTGTQLASTISDFNATARAQVEAELVAGSNITLTPSGSGDTRQITIASSGGGGGGGIGIDDWRNILTYYRIVDMGWPSSAVATGTGGMNPQAGTGGQSGIDCQTGATAGSTVYRVTAIITATNNAGAISVLDWSRPIYALINIGRVVSSTNSIFRFSISQADGGIVSMTRAGMGFEIRNQRFWLIAHNGTARTELDTGVDCYTAANNMMRIESNGLGTVTLHRGSTLIGTTAGCTTGTGVYSNCHTGIINGADASNARFIYGRTIFFKL